MLIIIHLEISQLEQIYLYLLKSINEWDTSFDMTMYLFFQNSTKLPKNGQEFVREWRKCKNPGDQYDFLISLGGEFLGTIFKSEISFGLLGDMIKSLSDVRDKDEKTIVDILKHLSKTNRFSLNVQFLSKQEKEYCASLFQTLSTRASHSDLTFSEKSVEELAQIYGMQL